LFCALCLLHCVPCLSFAFSHSFRPSTSASDGPVVAALASGASPSVSPETRDAKQKSGGRRGRRKAAQWIACSSTVEVTRAIECYVREGDVVAELGSQLRDSSVALCAAIGPAGRAVLVDVRRKFPDERKGADRTRAMRRDGEEEGFFTDRATFVQTDAFEFWREALFFRERRPPRYDVLVVDVSTVAGNDLDLTCVSLIKEFLALNHGRGEGDNPCRTVIVKSGSLQKLARRLYHAQRIVSGAHSPERRGVDNGTSSIIIGAVGVKQYRETIPFAVRRGDVCVEVGCHLGTTTALIDSAAAIEVKGNQSGDVTSSRRGGCLGVDVGPHIIKSAKKKYSHLPFEVANGFHTGELARMREKYFGESDGHSSVRNIAAYDVVYVDIGGLSGSEGLLEAISLLASVTNSLEPRCIVIKSLCVRRLASCLIPFSEVWMQKRAQRAN